MKRAECTLQGRGGKQKRGGFLAIVPFHQLFGVLKQLHICTLLVKGKELCFTLILWQALCEACSLTSSCQSGLALTVHTKVLEE